MKTINLLCTFFVVLIFSTFISAQEQINDADNDTRVETERVADEDIIRFRVGGTDVFRMKNRTLSILNTGNSVFIGKDAGISDDLTNNNNLFIGTNTGSINTTGANNAALGTNCFKGNIAGSGNFACGTNAMEFSNSNNNVAMGSSAMRYQTTGFNNVAIGSSAGLYNQTGSKNTLIGASAGRGTALHNKTGNVFIGYQAGYNETGSNLLYISNTNTSSPLIWGNFSSNLLDFNADVDVLGSIDIEGANEFLDFHATSSSYHGMRFYDNTTFDGAILYRPSDEAINLTSHTNGNGFRYNFASNDASLGVALANQRGKFHILNTSGINDPELNLESTGTGFSRLEFSNSGGDGFWHIAGRSNGSAPTMNFFYDADGGGAIVGKNYLTIDADEEKVIITEGDDVTLTAGGKLQLGSSTSTNLVFDDNEIEARDNGVESIMYVQRDGGNLSLCGTENGQVGIGLLSSGYPSSDYLLAVDGKIISEELKIQTSGDWPDYVFEEGYELKSLEEVEASINEHGHLPGIPSAKEIEADGGHLVGDIQKITLEKVEELTLYLIESNKQMKALQVQNDALLKRIEELENK